MSRVEGTLNKKNIVASKIKYTPVRAYDHYIISCKYSRNGTTYSKFMSVHDLYDTTTGE